MAIIAATMARTAGTGKRKNKDLIPATNESKNLKSFINERMTNFFQILYILILLTTPKAKTLLRTLFSSRTLFCFAKRRGSHHTPKQ